MNLQIRAVFAALIVVVVAAAGALFIGYRNGVAVSQGLDVATTGDVRDLFASTGTSGTRLVSLALIKLESSYYKPVDPETPVSGEVSALRAYLKSKHVPNATLPGAGAPDNATQDADRASEILAYAQSHYADKLGPDGRAQLSDVALHGVMDSVKDPYTVYLSQRDFQGLNESLSGGNFGGIGVYIYQLKDGRVVVQPIEDMPASQAGMKPGEVVDTVGGKPVHGIPLDKVETMIRGEAGTTVLMTTHPYTGGGRERSYSIVREIIHVPSVHARMEGGIDYIRLADFGDTSGAEIRKAVLEGKAKGAKGYILDLRNNGGGFLTAAVQISSLWVPQGTIVSTIKRDGTETTEEALGTAIPNLQPLVILVNKYTASASEITAGALQDYRLATLIGTKTFGKGVVQSIYPIPGEGALKITTARYVTPHGRDIQHRGIEPDVVINQDADPALIDTPADKQLAAAKARIKELTH
jgi:carboxyl-terminal processing protease